MAVFSTSFAQEAENLPYLDDFKSISKTDWHVATHASPEKWFDTDWRADHAIVDRGLSLKVGPSLTGRKSYSGASLRRKVATGYGRYEAIMQPAKGSGIVTGFFTYTGPYYGKPHDEIDIEFLGKDTTRLHAAIFVGGNITNKFIDLGFDAADAPRLYAFEWRPDSVRWYAGEKMIYEMRAEDQPLPSEPGMIFTNIWGAHKSIAIWSGEPAKDLAGTSHVHCVSYAPLAGDVFVQPKVSCASMAERLVSSGTDG